MKHAGPAALDRLAPLRAELRALGGLVERTPGAFYRRSKAWAHFHEDPSGLYADARLDGQTFQRERVDTPAEQAQWLARVRAALGA